MKREWNMYNIAWNRLAPYDDVQEVIDRMTESNLGATQFINGMIERNYLMEIYMCDNLKLYAGELYLFWKDCCQRNYQKVSSLLYKYNIGEITELFIKSHITPMGGLPIKTFDEWVQSSKSIVEFYQAGDMVSEDIIAFYAGMGEKAAIVKDDMLQLCSCNHAHNDDGVVTPLYGAFKKANGVWGYIGVFAKLKEGVHIDVS